MRSLFFERNAVEVRPWDAEDLEKLRLNDAISQKLLDIGEGFGLKNLYFIRFYSPPDVIVFGYRGNITETSNWNALQNQIEELIKTLRPACPSMPNFVFVGNPQQEIEILLKDMEPYIQQDGGHIEVVSVNEKSGIVVLSLQGACSGCPHSVGTLKAGIERHLQQYLPWVVAVKPDKEPEIPDFGYDL